MTVKEYGIQKALGTVKFWMKMEQEEAEFEEEPPSPGSFYMHINYPLIHMGIIYDPEIPGDRKCTINRLIRHCKRYGI